MSIFQTIGSHRFFKYLVNFLVDDYRRIFDSTVSLMALLPIEITGILWISLFAGFYRNVLFYVFIFMIITQLWFYLVIDKIYIDYDARRAGQDNKKVVIGISHVLYSIGSATMMYCALQHYFGMKIIYSILLSLILILVNIVLCGIMFVGKNNRESILGYCFLPLFKYNTMFLRFFQIETYSLSHMINIITISIFGILFVKSILPDFFKKYLKTNVVKYMLLGKYITYVSLSLLLFAFVVTLGLGLVRGISLKEDARKIIIVPKSKVVIDVWETKDINFASLRELLTKLRGAARRPPPTSEELKPLWDAMETLCQGWSQQTISKFKEQLGENKAYYVDQEQVYCKPEQKDDWERNDQYSRANGRYLMLQVLRIRRQDKQDERASLYYVLDLEKQEVFRALYFNSYMMFNWISTCYTYAMPSGSTLSTTAESLIKSLVNENLEYNTEKSAEWDLLKSNMQELYRRMCASHYAVNMTVFISPSMLAQKELTDPCPLIDCSFLNELYQ